MDKLKDSIKKVENRRAGLSRLSRLIDTSEQRGGIQISDAEGYNKTNFNDDELSRILALLNTFYHEREDNIKPLEDRLNTIQDLL